MFLLSISRKVIERRQRCENSVFSNLRSRTVFALFPFPFIGSDDLLLKVLVDIKISLALLCTCAGGISNDSIVTDGPGPAVKEAIQQLALQGADKARSQFISPNLVLIHHHHQRGLPITGMSTAEASRLVFQAIHLDEQVV